MKRSLLFLYLFILTAALSAQSQRTVLIEEFTQASCPPCEVSTPAFNQITEQNKDKIVQIRYHTSWPGVDPMNADNPVDAQSRVSYYGVTGVPAFFVAGTQTTFATSVLEAVPTQQEIDAASAMSAPFLMEMTHEIDDALENITINLTVTNEDTLSFDPAGHKLRIAIVEEEVNWPFTPGSTSIVDYEYVMKSFPTSTAGVDLDVLEASSSVDYTWTVELPTTIYDYNKIAVVAFVQNEATNNVVQATDSKAIALSGYPDIAISGVSDLSSALCDYVHQPSIDVVNNSDIPVEGYTVSLFVNGAEVSSISVDETLEANETGTVVFDDVDLSGGTTSMNYEVDANNARDIVTLNNLSSIASTNRIFPDPVSDLEYTFEGSQDNIIPQPNGMFLEKPFAIAISATKAEAFGLTGSMGAFGQSTYTLFCWLFQWPNVLGSGSITFDREYSIPDAGAKLVFDRAHTTLFSSNERLQIQVSTDCGASYTDVWDKSGSELATRPELNNTASFGFAAAASDWVSDEADLSAFANQDVLIRFLLTPSTITPNNGGDNLFLDNIQVQNLSQVDDLVFDERIELYPNPANEIVNVEIDLAQPSSVQVQLIDVLGKTVVNETLSNQHLGKSNYQLNTTDLTPGIYNVYLRLGEREVVRRLNIVR